jgi:hypothetical protein
MQIQIEGQFPLLIGDVEKSRRRCQSSRIVDQAVQAPVTGDDGVDDAGRRRWVGHVGGDHAVVVRRSRDPDAGCALLGKHLQDGPADSRRGAGDQEDLASQL